MPSRESKYRIALDGYEEELLSSLHTPRSVIGHPGEKGTEIETQVRSALERVLPPKVGVSHGFVIDSDGSVSKQMDVILYNKMGTPKIYDAENSPIFPVESTYACGEVKTTLDSSSVNDCIAKCDSYKKLRRQAYPNPQIPPESRYGFIYFYDSSPLYYPFRRWRSVFFVIAHETKMKLSGIAEKMLRHRRMGFASLGIDSLVVLNNGNDTNVVTNAALDADGKTLPKSVCFTPDRADSVCHPIYTQNPWTFFVSTLLHLMVIVPDEPVDMLQYHDISRGF